MSSLETKCLFVSYHGNGTCHPLRWFNSENLLIRNWKNIFEDSRALFLSKTYNQNRYVEDNQTAKQQECKGKKHHPTKRTTVDFNWPLAPSASKCDIQQRPPQVYQPSTAAMLLQGQQGNGGGVGTSWWFGGLKFQHSKHLKKPPLHLIGFQTSSSFKFQQLEILVAPDHSFI